MENRFLFWFLSSLTLGIFVFSCADKTVNDLSTVTESETKEVLGPKESEILKKANAWGTLYYSPSYKSSSSGYPIRDANCKVIGPKLSLKDFCNMGLQGSGIVDGVTYSYTDSSSKCSAPCKYGSVKYKIVKGLGKGVYGPGEKEAYELVAFKSIAVDPKEIPYGSKVFIPAAVGVVLPNGKTHDGYFIAHDTGAAIKNDDYHIDFFLGAISGGLENAIKLNPFSFVKSRKDARFDVWVLK